MRQAGGIMMDLLFGKIIQAIMSTNTLLLFSSYDEDQGSKVIRRAKEALFVPIGVGVYSNYYIWIIEIEDQVKY
jgi:hypothetical protein